MKKFMVVLFLLPLQLIGQEKNTFINPIADGADPWVTKDKGYYYVCQSNAHFNSKGISVSKSKKLTEIGEKVQVWNTPEKGWNRSQVWAPELHKFGNKWYIYYTAGQENAPFIHQRSGVLESVTSDPQGEYIDKGILKTGEDKQDATHTIWSIDLTVAEIKGQLYALWSGWEKNSTSDKTPQHLYIAKMLNPWTISSERVLISSPEESWETGGPLNINEGPQFLIKNDNVFIIYSTRESWTPEYKLGQLRLKDINKSLLDKGNWEKSGPVFQGNEYVFGTGHASFTMSPDDSEWWIFYHSKKSSKNGWDRDLRLQKFNWKKNGQPNFGTPIPSGKGITVPSGQ